jgi:hypothetical protein
MTVKIQPYETEWKSWCPHPVPHIPARFGARPWLWRNPDPADPVSIAGHTDAEIQQLIQDHPILFLEYGSTRSYRDRIWHWCEQIGEARIVVSSTHIPEPVPASVRVIVAEELAYQFSRTLQDQPVPPQYHRRVRDLDHDYLLMARGTDQGRSHLVQWLHLLGCTDRAVLSYQACPVHLYRSDPAGANPYLRPTEDRSISPDPVYRFHVAKNLAIIPREIQRCHFYVSMDTDFLIPEQRLWPVTEKVLWGFTTHTPTMAVWYDSVCAQMQAWGYRTEPVPYRLPAESEQRAVARLAGEIQLGCVRARHPDWAQTWQDSQGEITEHNRQLTQGLWRRIDQSIERQIEELPLEFQQIQ